jgi:predicted nucleotidyltransferase
LIYDKIINSGGGVMTVYNDLELSSLQKEALAELKTELIRRFDPEKLIIFGSTARGDFDDESDIDLLVITKWPYSRSERHQITDIVFEVNLKYGTNISSTVVDHQSWSYGPFSVLPIKHEIERDGIAI